MGKEVGRSWFQPQNHALSRHTHQTQTGRYSTFNEYEKFEFSLGAIWWPWIWALVGAHCAQDEGERDQ